MIKAVVKETGVKEDIAEDYLKQTGWKKDEAIRRISSLKSRRAIALTVLARLIMWWSPVRHWIQSSVPLDSSY